MLSPGMNNERLNTLIQEKGNLQETHTGYWRFEYREHVVLVMTDESHNRMRVMTPVAEVTELDESIWLLALTANFDRALDARYAVNGEYLWSVYIHPLRQLGDDQFIDGLEQVITLANNFGTSFSSSELVFGGG